MFKKIKKYINSSKALPLIREQIKGIKLISTEHLKVLDLTMRIIFLLQRQIVERKRLDNNGGSNLLRWSMETAINTMQFNRGKIYKNIADLELSQKSITIKLKKLGW